MEIQVEIQPLNRSTGVRPTIRLCSADDKRVTAFSGDRFWPAITRRPTLNMTLFDGDFTGQIATGAGSMTISAFGLKRADANAPGYAWNAAPISIWSIVPETGVRTLRFSGIVERFSSSNEQITIDIRVDTEAFVQNALPLTYAGTGGIEGPVDLRGKVKPLVLGRCFNVEPALINATDNVYQVSAYGPIDAVEVLYERGSAFGASFGDYASYAALVAAAIPNGGWATCLAQGLIRLKAPAYGVITADVRGDKPSGVLLRKTGEIINRLCSIASVPGANIESTSLTALDTALNSLPNQGRIGIYLTEQVRLLDLIQQLARPCNAAAGISWLGQLFVCRTAIGSAAAVFDAQGRRRPAISAVSEQSVSPPYWRIEMQGARSWRVHSDAEIAQGFIPGDEVANAVAPNGANRVRYSLMEGDQGWDTNFNPSALALSETFGTFNGKRFFASIATTTAASQTVVIGQAGAPAGQFPVTPGERLSVQARVDAFNQVASWAFSIWFVRADGSRDAANVTSGTGQVFANSSLQQAFVTAPTGGTSPVSSAFIELLATSSAAGTMQLAFVEPMVTSAATGQTVHPAFTPGPNAANGADVTAAQPIVSRLSDTTGQALGNFVSNQGNPFAQLVASGEARDGDVITFPTTLSAPPRIFFLPGGKSVAADNIRIEASGLSTSGFTMIAKSQTVTVGSTITDGSSTAGGTGEPDRIINRTNSGAPFDGRFTYRFSVTVGNVAPGEPGFAEVALFARKSGNWTEVGREIYSVSGTYNRSVTPGTVDFGTGSEFGVSLVYGEGTGTALTGFTHVQYVLGTVTEASLTPSNASPIPWQAFL